jgi:hypothetical protein
MRKKDIYLLTLILLILFFWVGYYFYMEYKPVVYKNGTFVEMVKDEDLLA